MAGPVSWIARSLLFRFDPETAHYMAIRALSIGMLPASASADPRLRRVLFDLDFPSPVGMAAGFDKDAEAFAGLLRIGLGFVEVGTVTPRSQPGNRRPRMFRLEKDGAIINRLGFNNSGMLAVHQRLSRAPRSGIIAVNIGANRDSADRIGDYVAGIETFADIAAYLAINISSPNTPGLRDLQSGEALEELLQRAIAARDEATNGQRATPLLLKIAPDLDAKGLEEIAGAVKEAGIDGMIVANTTLDRSGLQLSRHVCEAGGLSGRPLFRRSTAMLARLRKLVGPEMPLIGVGGIDSADAAWTKIAAGADLIQVYTGMIYEGHTIAEEINRGLAERLDREGVGSISEVVGVETDHWAASS